MSLSKELLRRFLENLEKRKEIVQENIKLLEKGSFYN